VSAQRGAGGSNGAQADSTLALARFLNNTAYRDFPPKAIEHAKMILASTFASAAMGSVIESARIVRQLAKEQGGKPEATIWFDGTKVPVSEAARVNAILSDAAASDDSDIRNTAHEGTTLTSVGLAIACDDQKHIRDRLLERLQAVQDAIEALFWMDASEEEQRSLSSDLRKSRQKLSAQVVSRSRTCARAERDKLSGRQP
jgi:hypothetical protein